MIPNRPSKEDFYLGLAKEYSRRATCSRAQHGAVIVMNDVPVAWGYNGAPRGTRHCDHSPVVDKLHNPPDGTPKQTIEGDMENGHCAVAVHAEVNSIINAARIGVSVLGGEMFLTGTPCFRPCAPLLINAGLKRVVYGSDYRPDERIIPLFTEAGVELVRRVDGVNEVLVGPRPTVTISMHVGRLEVGERLSGRFDPYE